MTYRGPGRYYNQIEDEEVEVIGVAMVGGLAHRYMLYKLPDDEVDDEVGFFAERSDVFDENFTYVGALA